MNTDGKTPARTDGNQASSNSSQADPLAKLLQTIQNNPAAAKAMSAALAKTREELKGKG